MSQKRKKKALQAAVWEWITNFTRVCINTKSLALVGDFYKLLTNTVCGTNLERSGSFIRFNFLNSMAGESAPEKEEKMCARCTVNPARSDSSLCTGCMRKVAYHDA